MRPEDWDEDRRPDDELPEDPWMEEAGDEDKDEDWEIPPRPRWPLRIVAGLVIAAFLAVSLPSLQFLFQGFPGFVGESQELLEDEIVRQSAPAVVSIEARMPLKDGAVETRQGTGFNIAEDGSIVTNRHVVEGAEQVIVRFPDGTSYGVSSYKTAGEVDLALLSIDGAGLPALVLDTKEEAKPGDMVTVIGNPLGYKRIAQRGEILRKIEVEDSPVAALLLDMDLNPGNSGSPVLNGQGRVVAVVFAVTVSDEEEIEGKGLALPVQSLESLIPE